jgi:DNA primase
MSHVAGLPSRPSPVEAARARHRLADVAGRTGIALGTVSGTVTVGCPMASHGHPDRTPSMRLYLDDDRYYCFGCGAKGDVVQWARDAEGLGVLDAVQALDAGGTLHNAWAGCAVVSRAPWVHRQVGAARAVQGLWPDLGRTPVERVLAALQAAWAYYAAGPLHARGARYLAGRGIDVRVLETFTGRAEVGHTPEGPFRVVSALRARGFSPDELVDAGLAQRDALSGALSDFYRQRALVPLRDDEGLVVGMVGRNVGHPSYPKYKNPPRTVVYDKSATLYQPLPAPTGRSGQVVVVEGTLDALAIAVAAIKAGKASDFCPVTQSGRELSDAQVRRVTAMRAGRVVLGFDGDDAGRESAARYSKVFARTGKTVSVTLLPHGHDPASWLADRGDRGLSAWSVAGKTQDRVEHRFESAAGCTKDETVSAIGVAL